MHLCMLQYMDLSKQDNKQIDQLINYNHISDTLMWRFTSALGQNRPFYPRSGAEPGVLPCHACYKPAHSFLSLG